MPFGASKAATKFIVRTHKKTKGLRRILKEGISISLESDRYMLKIRARTDVIEGYKVQITEINGHICQVQFTKSELGV